MTKIVICVDLSKKRAGRRGIDREYRKACKKIEEIISLLGRKTIPNSSNKAGRDFPVESNISRENFEEMVRNSKEYIHSGDVIQVVLSQRLKKRTSSAPFDIYRSLRTVNPSPYMYYLNFGSFRLIGSSPEILVRKEGSAAETRPIAGTRPRGRTAAEDKRLETDLLNSVKEKAEHIMLVDLGRNDLGRVCRYNSVKVSRLMDVERYSHVMHMVSYVTGRLKPGTDSFDLFRACFPAGTVSGAPKIRAMQIISELENSARGPYAGAVGYFSYSGNMDMAINIRTILYKDGVCYVQAGAGIVADSNPGKEYQETKNKAEALFVSIRQSEKNDSCN